MNRFCCFFFVFPPSLISLVGFLSNQHFFCSHRKLSFVLAKSLRDINCEFPRQWKRDTPRVIAELSAAIHQVILRRTWGKSMSTWYGCICRRCARAAIREPLFSGLRNRFRFVRAEAKNVDNAIFGGPRLHRETTCHCCASGKKSFSLHVSSGCRVRGRNVCKSDRGKTRRIIVNFVYDPSPFSKPRGRRGMR